MIGEFYLECNSAYRNRQQWPFPGDFDVYYSQSGQKNKYTAVDPISDSAIRILFESYGTINGTIATWAGIGTASSTTDNVIIILIPTGSIPLSQDYLSGAVIQVGGTGYTRILETRYLKTSGGNDYFKVTVDSPISPQTPGSAIVLTDPTDFTDSASPLIFLPSGVNSNNYYINYIIYNQTRDEYLPISYYSSVTHIAKLNTTGATNYTAGTWTTTDTFTLRRSPPQEIGLYTMTVTNQVNVGSSLTDYVGGFLYLRTTDENRRVVSYDQTTGIATVSKAFSTLSVGIFEFWPFSRDNDSPFSYNGSFVSQREAVCFDVELLNLVLPNTLLNTSSGSRAVFYPHVYVQLEPISNSEKFGPNAITSNNPNSVRMLIRAVVSDTNNYVVSPFVRIDGGKMIQRVKVQPNDSFHFSVHLPDGNIFTTEIPEYFSPDSPNPLKQISAIFRFTRVLQK